MHIFQNDTQIFFFFLLVVEEFSYEAVMGSKTWGKYILTIIWPRLYEGHPQMKKQHIL